MTDVASDRDHLARELGAVRDEVRRGHDQLVTFARQVSHDLRNPLTAVSMSLQMLAEQPSVVADEEALWMVRRALSGAQRIDALIESLLEYAKLGSLLHTADVDLGRLLAEVTAGMGAALRGAKLEVGDLPVVSGDRSQLTVLLRHLLVNAAALVSSPARVRITVAAHRIERGWRIEIGDDGPGVPAEDRERVFGLLSRGDTRTEGAGVGLAACRRIVGAHGGSIGLEESSTGGALVWFELPAQDRC